MKLYRTTQYRTENYIINKALTNQAVNELMVKHYKELARLIVSKKCEDIFNDTYLLLTVKYQPNLEFVKQFKYHYFYLFKRFQHLNYGRYEVTKEEIDYSEPDETDYSLPDTKEAQKLINEIKQYAVKELKDDLARRKKRSLA